MSKLLSDEYKKMALSEVPDLWDRIESQLMLKTAPDNRQEKIPVSIEKNTKDHNPAKRGINHIHLYKAAGLFAAGICIAVIPAILLMNRSTKKYSAEDRGDMAAVKESDSLNETESIDAEEAKEGNAYLMNGRNEAEQDFIPQAEAETQIRDLEKESEKLSQEQDLKEVMADRLAGRESGELDEPIKLTVNEVFRLDGEDYVIAVVVMDQNGIWAEDEQFIFSTAENTVLETEETYSVKFLYDPEEEFYLKAVEINEIKT